MSNKNDTQDLTQNQLCEEIRALFRKHRILALNMVGAVGSGKSSLIEQTIRRLDPNIHVGIITCDLVSASIYLDASEPDFVINNFDKNSVTGKKQVTIHLNPDEHLKSSHIHDTLRYFDLADLDLLIIENLGDLIYTANHDLGENYKVCVLSVPEGDETPAKYAPTLLQCDMVVLNKTDLVKFTNFNTYNFYNYFHKTNNEAEIFELSALTGTGIEAWCRWLVKKTMRM